MSKFVSIRFEAFYSPKKNQVPSGLVIQVASDGDEPTAYAVHNALADLGYCDKNGPTLSPKFEVI
jgi:hypothetical protein